MSREELILELKNIIEEELQAYFKPVGDKISESIPNEAKGKAKAWYGDAVQYVEKHPLQAVGIATAAGFLIARFFYRGKD